MPIVKFTDQQLLDLYNGEDEPSLYRISQILDVGYGSVKARAKKLGLKRRPKKRSELSKRRIHSILVMPKTLGQVTRLSKKLKTTKSDVWEQAIDALYHQHYR